MSKYVGIKAGTLHEHTELSEYYCARCGCPVTDHDSYCRECGGAFQRSFATEPYDRKILLALADKVDRSATELLKVNDLDSNRKRRSMRRKHAQDLMVVSSRIREALGMENHASHDDEPV